MHVYCVPIFSYSNKLIIVNISIAFVQFLSYSKSFFFHLSGLLRLLRWPFIDPVTFYIKFCLICFYIIFLVHVRIRVALFLLLNLLHYYQIPVKKIDECTLFCLNYSFCQEISGIYMDTKWSRYMNYEIIKKCEF